MPSMDAKEGLTRGAPAQLSRNHYYYYQSLTEVTLYLKKEKARVKKRKRPHMGNVAATRMWLSFLSVTLYLKVGIAAGTNFKIFQLT